MSLDITKVKRIAADYGLDYEALAEKLSRIAHGVEAALDLTAERARLACAQANKAELEYEQLKGRLIPVELVIATWSAMVAAARAKLLSLPSKIAHKMMAAKTLMTAERAIRDHVSEALTELSRQGLPEDVKQVIRDFKK